MMAFSMKAFSRSLMRARGHTARARISERLNGHQTLVLRRAGALPGDAKLCPRSFLLFPASRLSVR